MKIKRFKIFEASVLWDDFINKVNTGVLPKDIADSKSINKLTKLIPDGSKILDISIGDGANSEYFIEQGFEVYGTDISKLAIDTIKEEYPDYTWVEHDTLESFPFPDNFFNLIFVSLTCSINPYSSNCLMNLLYRCLLIKNSLCAFFDW